jgi:hypothetical protein
VVEALWGALEPGLEGGGFSNKEDTIVNCKTPYNSPSPGGPDFVVRPFKVVGHEAEASHYVFEQAPTPHLSQFLSILTPAEPSIMPWPTLESAHPHICEPSNCSRRTT